MLVWQDMAGLSSGRPAKFVKRFAEIGATLQDAAERFGAEVRTGAYPGRGARVPLISPNRLARRCTIGVVPAAVDVVDLVKRYPKRPVNAVDGVTFTVETGEVFGFLGPNGAGKSTTIGILTTRVLATSGQARVAGIDVLGDPVRARSRARRRHRSGSTSTGSCPRGRTCSSTRTTTACRRRSGSGAPTSCWSSSGSATAARTRSTSTPAARRSA